MGTLSSAAFHDISDRLERPVVDPCKTGKNVRIRGLKTDNAGAEGFRMAARPTWKGFLKISLVNIPVRVFPATDSAATISFNQLHAECQTRIQQKRWCPTCEREVPMSEIAKGYEFEKGRYVVMSEEDVSKVRPESTRVIDLVQFTDAAAIDPIYVERPYYLAPDGKMGTDAFAVMREGMKGKAGIGKLALYGREYLVAVLPKDNGLVMYTLRHSKEVRSMDNIDELQNVPSKVKPEEIKLAKQVIENFEGELNWEEYRDEYQEELQRIIDAKIAGEEVVATEEEAPPKVVNLMDALRQSLDRVSTGKKKAAKADMAVKPEKVVAAPKKRAAR
jgi:DNA end-binding protein Ku